MTADIALKVVLAVVVGLAFVTNLILYTALRAKGIEVRFMLSAKPGYLENLYRQAPSLRSALLSTVAGLCTLSKILVIAVGIGLVLVGSLKR
jgi:hypothetical protein